MATFHTYDPQTLGQQSQPKACEACYVRKVKCDIKRGEDICRNCLHHGTECRPRARKRKGTSENTLTVGQTSANPTELGPAQSLTNTSRKRQRAEASGQQTTEANQFHMSGTILPSSQTVEDNDLSAPLLFIGQQSNLASSPSTTADAISASVDEFHNSSYLSRAAVLGIDFPDIDHSHVDQPVRQHKLSVTELKVLELYGAFDLPELPLRQSLIEAFHEKCWTWMPVVDLPSRSQDINNSEISLLPLQAVLLVGALMRPDICGKSTCDTFYYRVKSLIHSGYERNPLNILAALCLIQYYTPTAPKDVSVDTPRFWWSCALGIAQQIGLHRQPTRRGGGYGLRRRIWWTLYVRDGLMSSAHGRPRLLRLADSTMDPPSPEDFLQPDSLRVHIFVAYVGITEIMCDLCELLVNNNAVALEQRHQIEHRLLSFVRGLPEALLLYDGGGLQRSYDFDLAQLHIPLLTTITILYRPQSIFALDPSNAASVAAGYLNFRIFQAIELREQTRFLSSSFSWYLLVTAIPHLSSLKVPALRKEANAALNAIEGVLATLGTVRPSATTNLQNVRAIRKALSAQDSAPSRDPRLDGSGQWPHHATQQHSIRELLGIYGPQALRNYDAVTNAISHTQSFQTLNSENAFAADLDGMTGDFQQADHQDPQLQNIEPDFGADVDVDGALASLFGTHFQENMWMRNWIDELQPFTDG